MTESIFMIHGMWGGGWHWENYTRFFEEKGYKCFAPYLRHHDVQPGAKPPKGLGSTGLLDYAEDFEDEIRKLKEKPIVIGHSMGGLLAQILAARDLAKATVLITPASPSGINALKWSVIKSFFGSIIKLKFLGYPHKLSYRAAVYAMLHLMPIEEQNLIYNRCVYESGKAAREIGFWFFDFKRASNVNESKVTCPMLVISGSDDRITPANVVKKVADKYQGISTYKEFKDHAHFLLGEPGWGKISEYIHKWIEMQNCTELKYDQQR
jgi:pimeloyl-ACP methyl ester carboxylesterase